MKLAASILAFLGCAQSLLIIELPWEDTWKELVIEALDEVNHKEAFQGWKRAFNKEYETMEEEAEKFLTWLDNWYMINKHNLENKASHTLRMNQFSDLTRDEFRHYIHGSTDSCFQTNSSMAKKPFMKIEEYQLRDHNKSVNTTVPDAWDWTNVNGVSWVTPVKNQGSCGGCWAFSAVGAIESGAVITNYYNAGQAVPDPIPQLSEQQLIDCSKSYGNMGCNGGLMDDAFKYVLNSGGLCSEEEYKYTAKDGTCAASTCGTKYDPIATYTDVDQKDAPQLEAAVAQHPVSIAIEADQMSFQFYHSGVFDGRCGDNLDHGVLLVGYGTENGMDFWKIKNSWGTTWGDQGYIKICRNCNKNDGAGECGVLMSPSYPVAKKE